ncbi:MAG TPA: hypothetical protein VFK73_01010, partial [Paludibacter sp.]|nr:hypothetical protein [Paludibacter sp.]
MKIGKLDISDFVDVLLQNILKITKMGLKFNCIFLLAFTALLSACDDMKDVPTPVDLPVTSGETGKMYVLSEGLFNMNNSTLSLLNFDNRTINSDFFLFQNNR